MGIDADAYMSGAIPSLSRGGSWQHMPDAGGNLYSQGSTSNGSGYGHGDSIFPRPSQIAPPPPPPPGHVPPKGMGNRSNAHFAHHHHHHHHHHPWAALARSQAQAGAQAQAVPREQPALTVNVAGSKTSKSAIPASAAGRSPTVGAAPTRHPGWASLHAGGYRSSPTSPTASSASASASMIASQAATHYGPIIRGTGYPGSHPWEWDSGSPKPMTAEPDYFSLPPTPGGAYASVPTTPNPATAQGQRMDSLPPPPKPAGGAGPQSPRPRVEAHGQRHVPPKSALSGRPRIPRRHTHDRYSPDQAALLERSGGSKAGKHESKSLGRTRGKSGLSKAVAPSDLSGSGSVSMADGSYYSASGRATMASSSHPPSTVGSGTYPQSIEPPTTARSAPRSTRPTIPSRRTTSTNTSSATPSTAMPAKTLAERRLKNRPHPALSTVASSATLDFTSTSKSASPTAASAPRTALDIRSLRQALPSPSAETPTTPMTAAPSASGYIPPTLDEDYDRYVAHPAAPVPPRADLPPEQLRAPPGAGLKQVTADSYRPPGFPKPLKDLGVNRDGPAMRTYGIAWDREGTAETLPGRPAGPRWIQARPPVPAGQPSGNWWQAAG